VGGSAAEEIQAHLVLYVYLLGGTCCSMALSGALAGALADRLHWAVWRLESLAMTDALTELGNRRRFHEDLSVECARADRHERPVALVMVDLDHFKRINDQYGHVAGDHALAHAARTIESAVRQGDTVYRIGGEEFAVLCPGCEIMEAAGVAERIRDSLAHSPFMVAPYAETVTASLGVAVYAPGCGAESVVTRADKALYTAKENGRNRVAVAGDSQQVPFTPEESLNVCS
jgi:diguanylate cyclase (GGDEF)-like protein